MASLLYEEGGFFYAMLICAKFRIKFSPPKNLANFAP